MYHGELLSFLLTVFVFLGQPRKWRLARLWSKLPRLTLANHNPTFDTVCGNARVVQFPHQHLTLERNWETSEDAKACMMGCALISRDLYNKSSGCSWVGKQQTHISNRLMDWIQLQPTKPTTRNCAGKSRGPSYVVIPAGEAFCNKGKQRNKLTRTSRLLHSISTILNTSRHISTQPLGCHLRLHKTLGHWPSPTGLGSCSSSDFSSAEPCGVHQFEWPILEPRFSRRCLPSAKTAGKGSWRIFIFVCELQLYINICLMSMQ